MDYCFTILGVGSSTSNNTINMPGAIFFAYVLLQGKQMKEFITADYGIDNSGEVISSDYTNGPPMKPRLVTSPWMLCGSYMNSFQFKMLREIIYGNLLHDRSIYTSQIVRMDGRSSECEIP
ncbi:MAG: hypothetical protein R2877_07065 [Bdellovibrionota bacterium]